MCESACHNLRGMRPVRLCRTRFRMWIELMPGGQEAEAKTSSASTTTSPAKSAQDCIVKVVAYW